MCGIVGYIGEAQAAPILLAGLGKLEYRGYDSAGIAVRNEATGKIEIVKEKTTAREGEHFTLSLENNVTIPLRSNKYINPFFIVVSINICIRFHFPEAGIHKCH